MSGILFTNVNVLDCSGDEPFAGEVLVRDQRIAAVSRESGSLPREGVQIVDGGGKTTLMPGLIESHAHLSIDNTDDLRAIGMVPPEESDGEDAERDAGDDPDSDAHGGAGDRSTPESGEKADQS